VRLLILGAHDRAVDLRRSLSQFTWIELYGDADDGRKGIAHALNLKPDAVLMSSGLWDMEYANRVGEIRRVSPSVEIVVISHPDDTQTRKEVLGAGATAYIPTTAVWISLMAVLREIEIRVRNSTLQGKKSN
jgi:two-component system, NarL family, response regulator LiaR